MFIDPEPNKRYLGQPKMRMLVETSKSPTHRHAKPSAMSFIFYMCNLHTCGEFIFDKNDQQTYIEIANATIERLTTHEDDHDACDRENSITD